MSGVNTGANVRPLRLSSDSRWLTLSVTLLLAILLSVGYRLLAPSLAHQHWDSLQYAQAVEESGIHALWGNHPLGHFVFSLVWRGVRLLLTGTGALPALATISSVLGGACVGVFFLTCSRTLGLDWRVSLGAACLMGVTTSYWRFAGTAEIYTLALLMQIIAFRSILNTTLRQSRKASIVAGSLTGISILAHQLNVLLVPVSLLIVHLNVRARRPRMVLMILFLLAVSVVSCAGTMCFAALVTPITSLSEVYMWARGHIGNASYGSYLSVGNAPEAMRSWISTLVSPGWSVKTTAVRIGLLACMGSWLALGGVFMSTLGLRVRGVFVGSLWVCIATFGLILMWEPWNRKLWLLALPSLCLMLAYGGSVLAKVALSLGPGVSMGLARMVLQWMLVAVALLVWGHNLRLTFVPLHRDSSAFEEALDAWTDNTESGDVLITAGDLVPHLRYWSDRPNTYPLSGVLVRSEQGGDTWADLDGLVRDTLAHGRNVFISPMAGDYLSDRQRAVLEVRPKSGAWEAQRVYSSIV